jgi:uncharacterized OB-fold protein
LASAETMSTEEQFAPGLFVTGEAGAEPRLVVGVCQNCRSYSFPQREYCAKCGPGTVIKETMLGGAGVVFASTRVRVPSPVGIKAPYCCGYVDLDAASLRVFALFSAVCGEAPAPGTRVHLRVEPLTTNKAGTVLSSYRFSPNLDQDVK